MQLARAAAAAARLQWIGSSFRGGMKQLNGSAGLCVCRPRSACYFLEVIRPTLPHQGKALMISGSHEICTACRSRPPRFTEPRFATSSPPFLLSTVLSYYLVLSPPHLLSLRNCFPLFSIKSAFLSLSHFPETPLSVTLHQSNLSFFLPPFFTLHHNFFKARQHVP